MEQTAVNTEILRKTALDEKEDMEIRELAMEILTAHGIYG